MIISKIKGGLKMRKLISMLIVIAVGIFAIPALFAAGLTLFGTALAFLSEPRVMLVLLGVLAVLSFPGMVIMFVAKK